MNKNKDYKKLMKSNLIEIYVWLGIWIVSLFLSCLGLDLKLETFTNVCFSTFVVSSFWLLFDCIVVIVYFCKDKKQKKENKLDEKK